MGTFYAVGVNVLPLSRPNLILIMAVEESQSLEWLFHVYLAIAKLPEEVAKCLSNPVKLLENCLQLNEKNGCATGLSPMAKLQLTALLLEACRRGKDKMVSSLLQHLAICSPVALDYVYRYTLKELAVSVPSINVTRTLTIAHILDKQGISIVSRSNTLLHLAAEGNHLAIVQLLIKAGANVNAINCCGRTPLMLGILNYKITKALLSANAKVNLIDKQGLTALLIAIDCGSPPEVVSLLIEKGSDIHIQDNNGYSFLHKVYSLKPVSANYTSVLIQKKIFLTCSSSGLLCVNRVPLSIASLDSALLNDQDENPYLSKHVRLSLKFLKSSLVLVNFACVEGSESDFYGQLEEALQFKAYHNLFIEYPPTPTVYQQSNEVKSLTELAALSRNELAFQNLLIVERVAGFGSFMAIWLIIDTLMSMQDLGNNVKIALLNHVTTMINYRLKEYGIDKRITMIVQKVVDLIISLPSCSCVVITNLLYGVKLYLCRSEKTHSHHFVQTTSETRYRYSSCRGDVLNMMESVLNLLVFLHRHTQMDIRPFLTDFMDDLPLIVSAYDEVYSLLSLAYLHCRSIVKLMLECGAEKWIHTRILNGDFLINLVLKKKSRDNLIFADTLFELGMHHDSVGSNGLPLYKLLPAELHHHVPSLHDDKVTPLLPLMCLASNRIVSEGIQYWDNPFVPPQLIKFISLHDIKSFRKQLKITLDLP